MSEPPAPPHLVVFDLGGTTVHDRGEVPAAFEDALREAGIPFAPAELTTWRGASKLEVLRRLLARHRIPAGESPTRVADVYARFQSGLEERFALARPLSLPRIGESFERLRDAGIKVAIATGFDRRIVDLVLGAVDWAELVELTVCSENVPAGRPAPYMIFRAMEGTGVTDVHRVAVVGDTLLDLEAAWNAGADCRIGVLTGAHDRSTLRTGPCTHLLESAADVPNLWLCEQDGDKLDFRGKDAKRWGD